MTKISVIIPVYNVSEYLDKCLWSATNQTLRDIEIIVVNDGSTDNSLSVITKYAEKDNRIKIVTKKNEGLVLARKSGLDIAQGQYIHHLDGDDYMELNSYELLYNKAIETGSDMIVFEFNWCLTEFRKITRTENFESNIDFISQSIDNCEFMSLGLNFHKRKLYQNKIDFCKDLTIGEDSYLVKQLAYYSKKVSYLGCGLYNYILRGSSLMNQRINDKKAHDILLHNKLIINFFKDKPEYLLLEERLFSLYVNADAQLYWHKYFKYGHIRSIESIEKIKKYPAIALMRDVKPLYKLMKFYAINSLLGKMFARYYIIKKKIK